MVPKTSWTDKIKKWRREKAEHYARIIMSDPVKVPLRRIIKYPGLILVMGDRRMGKTGIAHEIGNKLHTDKGIPVVVHMPATLPLPIRAKIQRLLPKWMKLVTNRSEWPKNSVVIYDEAAQTAHARRSQSNDAIELDDLISISGQRNQTIIFIAHHSRKIDLNVVTEVNRIIWKKPTYAHQLFERDEVSDFSMKAYDFFDAMRQKRPWTEAKLNKAKKMALVLDFDEFEFYQTQNDLPPWWNEELSRLFQDVQMVKGVLE